MDERTKVLGIMAAIIGAKEGAVGADNQRLAVFAGTADRLLSEVERVHRDRKPAVTSTLNLDNPDEVSAVNESARIAHERF